MNKNKSYIASAFTLCLALNGFSAFSMEGMDDGRPDRPSQQRSHPLAIDQESISLTIGSIPLKKNDPVRIHRFSLSNPPPHLAEDSFFDLLPIINAIQKRQEEKHSISSDHPLMIPCLFIDRVNKRETQGEIPFFSITCSSFSNPFKRHEDFNNLHLSPKPTFLMKGGYGRKGDPELTLSFSIAYPGNSKEIIHSINSSTQPHKAQVQLAIPSLFPHKEPLLLKIRSKDLLLTTTNAPSNSIFYDVTTNRIFPNVTETTEVRKIPTSWAEKWAFQMPPHYQSTTSTFTHDSEIFLLNAMIPNPPSSSGYYKLTSPESKIFFVKDGKIFSASHQLLQSPNKRPETLLTASNFPLSPMKGGSLTLQDGFYTTINETYTHVAAFPHTPRIEKALFETPIALFSVKVRDLPLFNAWKDLPAPSELLGDISVKRVRLSTENVDQQRLANIIGASPNLQKITFDNTFDDFPDTFFKELTELRKQGKLQHLNIFKFYEDSLTTDQHQYLVKFIEILKIKHAGLQFPSPEDPKTSTLKGTFLGLGAGAFTGVVLATAATFAGSPVVIPALFLKGAATGVGLVVTNGSVLGAAGGLFGALGGWGRTAFSSPMHPKVLANLDLVLSVPTLETITFRTGLVDISPYQAYIKEKAGTKNITFETSATGQKAAVGKQD